MNEDLVTLVRTARFTPVFRQGYVMGDVDEFLDRVARSLSVGRPVAPMIEANRFPIASWTEAYNREEVDLLLAQVKHKAQVSDTAPEEEVEMAPPVVEAVRVPEPRTEGIVEKKRVFARIFGSN